MYSRIVYLANFIYLTQYISNWVMELLGLSGLVFVIMMHVP